MVILEYIFVGNDGGYSKWSGIQRTGFSKGLLWSVNYPIRRSDGARPARLLQVHKNRQDSHTGSIDSSQGGISFLQCLSGN